MSNPDTSLDTDPLLGTTPPPKKNLLLPICATLSTLLILVGTLVTYLVIIPHQLYTAVNQGPPPNITRVYIPTLNDTLTAQVSLVTVLNPPSPIDISVDSGDLLLFWNQSQVGSLGLPVLMIPSNTPDIPVDYITTLQVKDGFKDMLSRIVQGQPLVLATKAELFFSLRHVGTWHIPMTKEIPMTSQEPTDVTPKLVDYHLSTVLDHGLPQYVIDAQVSINNPWPLLMDSQRMNVSCHIYHNSSHILSMTFLGLKSRLVQGVSDQLYVTLKSNPTKNKQLMDFVGELASGANVTLQLQHFSVSSEVLVGHLFDSWIQDWAFQWTLNASSVSSFFTHASSVSSIFTA